MNLVFMEEEEEQQFRTLNKMSAQILTAKDKDIAEGRVNEEEEQQIRFVDLFNFII